MCNLGLGPPITLALGLVQFTFRLDILLNPLQDFRVRKGFDREGFLVGGFFTRRVGLSEGWVVLQSTYS